MIDLDTLVIVGDEAYTPEEWERHQRQRRHRHKSTEYNREWRARNREHRNAYNREWMRRYRAQNRDVETVPVGSLHSLVEGMPSIEPIDTPPAGSVAAATSEAAGSPLASPPPAAPATFSDPETLAIYAATVLGYDEPQPLKELQPADWEQVWASLKLADLTHYQSWYTAQDRTVRAALMTAHQSPTARRKALEAAAKAKPDADELRMGLEQ